MKNQLKKATLGAVFVLIALSCYYLWKIHHIPEGLELRSWFRIRFGCGLILVWQIAVIISAVVIHRLFISKVPSQLMRTFLSGCLILVCSCTILYLTWNYFGIQFANEKDTETSDGTLTVWHKHNLLISDDDSFSLYEKEGLLYRRYVREMRSENDYSPLESSGPAKEPDTTATASPAEAPTLDFEVIENRENELVFNRSLDEFVDCYNRLYDADHNAFYLSKPSEWKNFIYDSSVHSDHKTKLYEFSIDQELWTFPSITAYIPTNKDCIQEITVNFDDHAYSESFYDAYEELCYYTLKVFFPELSNEELTDLYTELNEIGVQNVFDHDQGYEKGCVPCVLYHKNGIGVYPYLAVGEWRHLCIIPVTEERLHDFAEQGVEIHEIQ